MRSASYCFFSLLFVLLAACADKDEPLTIDPMPPVESADTTITFLALGDSYTIGTGVTAVERWPRQLGDALLDRHLIGLERLDYVARNGWRTDNLATGIASTSLRAEYDLVSLLIGVNNQFQGFSVASYRPEFESLLNTAIDLAGGDKTRVFVVSIPDYAFTPFGGGNQQISQEIDAFNAAARDIAGRYEIPFYDITPISREGLSDPSLVAGDNLHPSGKQYGRWVDEVLLDPVLALIRRAG